MAKKGYGYEYLVKKRYEKQGVIFRLSIYSYADFLVLFPDSSIVLIECKTTIKSKWCPNKREKAQYKRLEDLSNKIKDTFVVERLSIIYCIREAGVEKELNLDEVKEKYFKNL